MQVANSVWCGTQHGFMNTNRRHAVAALIAAGLLWGTTVPLSKLALQWLDPGWLTVLRFGLAAAVLLPVARRRGQRVLEARVLLSGAVGYGGSVIVQNAGITRTSVTHAALLIGAVPVLVAVIAAVWHHTVARPLAWLGFAISLGGVGLVTAGGGGGGATVSGDGLVLLSLLLSATFTVAQARLLPGRDPVGVTAVQFLGAALGALAFTLVTEGAPAVPTAPGPVLAAGALALAGTLLPFTLFAYGQSRVSAEVAGAFLNLEPLVGGIAGVVFFANPAGLKQMAGGAAILAGIVLSGLPLLARGRGLPASARAAGRGHAAWTRRNGDHDLLCRLPVPVREEQHVGGRSKADDGPAVSGGSPGQGLLGQRDAPDGQDRVGDADGQPADVRHPAVGARQAADQVLTRTASVGAGRDDELYRGIGLLGGALGRGTGDDEPVGDTHVRLVGRRSQPQPGAPDVVIRLRDLVPVHAGDAERRGRRGGTTRRGRTGRGGTAGRRPAATRGAQACDQGQERGDPHRGPEPAFHDDMARLTYPVSSCA
jgi:O-acetylserine/cysteine efflux transporter